MDSCSCRTPTAFLQPGQWYLDPAAGKLYYRAAAGEDPNTQSFVLPRLESLVQIAGSYAKPVHDLRFSGIRFSYSTWLSPGSPIGYADQQNGAFIPRAYPQPADYLTSCQSGCPLFEGARNGWHQVPGAVQLAAATRIAFSDNTFAHLGQVGLGIGLDANANAAGIGLGVTETTVHHNLFTDLGGAGVVVGGVQPDAHHPSDPAMTLRDITIDNNLVTDVAKDYKEMSGILSTYADHTVIAHNEVSNLAYDGIDIGWGWGANDVGGSQDYQNRGLYAYQPVYTTPTTLKDTEVTANLIHGVKKVFHDGGSLYNLSANPGAVYSENYIYDTRRSVGLYLDEGSRYVTERNNVIQDCGVWVFTNSYGTANNTSDNVLEHNWYNSGVAQTPNAAEHNNQLIGNIQVSGTAVAGRRPAGDRERRHRAGPAYLPRRSQRAGCGCGIRRRWASPAAVNAARTSPGPSVKCDQLSMCTGTTCGTPRILVAATMSRASRVRLASPSSGVRAAPPNRIATSTCGNRAAISSTTRSDALSPLT